MEMGARPLPDTMGVAYTTISRRGEQNGRDTFVLRFRSTDKGHIRPCSQGVDALVHKQPPQGLPLHAGAAAGVDGSEVGKLCRRVRPSPHSRQVLNSPVSLLIAVSIAAISCRKFVVQPVSGSRGRSGRSVIRQLWCEQKAMRHASSTWMTLMSAAACWVWTAHSPMAHLLGGGLGHWRIAALLCSCDFHIHTSKRGGVRNLEVHHSRLRNARLLPGTHGRHAHIEKASDLCGVTQRLNDLCCMLVHAQILAQASNKCKPRLTYELIG